VVWMPAHTTEACVGVKRLSNGSLLTASDRRANARADEQAKLATEGVRVSAKLRQDFDDYAQNVFDACVWLGMVTWMANNATGPVKRDSGASALRALQHRQVRSALKEDGAADRAIRLPSTGGHLLVCDGQLQWCAMCGVRGQLSKIGHQRCSGLKREQWLQKSLKVAGDATPNADCALGHLRMLSGKVVWCDRCGAYGTHRGCGLAKACIGQATMGAGGGKWQRLRLLRSGRHPKSKEWLGSALPEARWDLTTVSSVAIALAETRKRQSLVDNKVAYQQSGQQSSSRLEMVKWRIRAKEAAGTVDRVIENKIALSSHLNTCVGLPTPVLSKLEALRLRVRSKEAKAMGERHAEG
jgi:hypothetical protein